MTILAMQLGVPFVLLLLLIASVEVGARLGRRHAAAGNAGQGFDTGAIQGAMLGLLGLLLGFSFAGAASRYMERQDLVTQEANAIGTAFLRADLLDDPARASLHTELRGYVASRIERSATLHIALTAQEAEAIDAAHQRIWSAALQGVNATPTATIAVLGPVNEVIDLHASRVAAGRKHLPGLVLTLLLACSILTLATLGYAGASAGKRTGLLPRTMALLIGAALWTTIDLDRPRIGLIRIADTALADLQRSLDRPPPTG